MARPILTEIKDLNHFKLLLQENPGVIIIKFGATWCGPCKKIEQLVHAWFDQMPEHVQPIIVDIDENYEIYAFLKSKKMVNGVPAILAYNKDNLSYIPSDAILGANPAQINIFFQQYLKPLET